MKNLQRHSLSDWQPGVPPLVEIQPVTYDRSAPNEIRRLRAAIGWEGAHRRVDGQPWPAGAESMFGWNSVVRVGRDGPTFVTSRNLEPIGYQDPFRPYYHGAPEPGFAIAVALLAERIAGRPAPSRPIG